MKSMKIPDEEVKQMLADADADGSGEVDFEEFTKMMLNTESEAAIKWLQMADQVRNFTDYVTQYLSDAIRRPLSLSLVD